MKKLLTLSAYVKQQLNEDETGGMPVDGTDPAAAPEGDTGAEYAGTGEPAAAAPEDDEADKVVYTIEAVDKEDKIKNLLNYIMGIGNQKRSFEIVVAPGDESIEKKFDWDGTGTDKIKSVKSSKDEEAPAAAPEDGTAPAEPAAAPEGEPAVAGQ